MSGLSGALAPLASPPQRDCPALTRSKAPCWPHLVPCTLCATMGKLAGSRFPSTPAPVSPPPPTVTPVFPDPPTSQTTPGLSPSIRHPRRRRPVPAKHPHPQAPPPPPRRPSPLPPRAQRKKSRWFLRPGGAVDAQLVAADWALERRRPPPPSAATPPGDGRTGDGEAAASEQRSRVGVAGGASAPGAASAAAAAAAATGPPKSVFRRQADNPLAGGRRVARRRSACLGSEKHREEPRAGGARTCPGTRPRPLVIPPGWATSRSDVRLFAGACCEEHAPSAGVPPTPPFLVRPPAQQRPHAHSLPPTPLRGTDQRRAAAESRFIANRGTLFRQRRLPRRHLPGAGRRRAARRPAGGTWRCSVQLRDGGPPQCRSVPQAATAGSAAQTTFGAPERLCDSTALPVEAFSRDLATRGGLARQSAPAAGCRVVL